MSDPEEIIYDVPPWDGADSCRGCSKALPAKSDRYNVMWRPGAIVTYCLACFRVWQRDEAGRISKDMLALLANPDCDKSLVDPRFLSLAIPASDADGEG